MSVTPTVKIVCDWRADGWLIINADDFQKDTHVLWKPEAKTEAKPQLKAATGGS